MKIIPNKTKTKWLVVEDYSTSIKSYVMASSKEEAEKTFYRKGFYPKSYTRQMKENIIVEGVEVREAI